MALWITLRIKWDHFCRTLALWRGHEKFSVVVLLLLWIEFIIMCIKSMKMIKSSKTHCWWRCGETGALINSPGLYVLYDSRDQHNYGCTPNTWYRAWLAAVSIYSQWDAMNAGRSLSVIKQYDSKTLKIMPAWLSSPISWNLPQGVMLIINAKLYINSSIKDFVNVLLQGASGSVFPGKVLLPFRVSAWAMHWRVFSWPCPVPQCQ